MRRSFAVVVACCVIRLLVPVAAGAAPAVQPNNRPAPVSDTTNGRLPPEMLIGVAPGCVAFRAAAPSLALVFDAARAEGLAIGASQCYRPLAEQVAVRAEWTRRGQATCAARVVSGPGGPVGTSMHGWGKAVDLVDGGRTMTFSSTGYRYLKVNAARYGWNHPGWAEPGGSGCDEPWHWEWVGDGGILGGDPIRADVTGIFAAADNRGYSVVTGLGSVAHRGAATDHGSAVSLPLNWVIVDAAGAPDGGYWLVASDGGVFGFGNATFYGSTGGLSLHSPIVAMAPTPSGQGYWLAAADGGVFAFGDAAFHGSTGGMTRQRPIVGMAAAPDGAGYWLVASDGGVFAFGSASSLGSMGGTSLNRPIVAMVATPAGDGYWLVASDGGVFGFGTAGFHGSAGALELNLPIVGMAPSSTGDGYWLVGADGGVFNYGDAGFYGAG